MCANKEYNNIYIYIYIYTNAKYLKSLLLHLTMWDDT